jgi:hypothetical protein
MATHHIAKIELFRIDHEITTSLQEIDDEDLCSFVKLHEDPINDEQIELYIYACFFIFEGTGSTKYLEQAIQRTEGWIAVTLADHPDRVRRSLILDMMSVRMHQQNLILENAMSTPLGIR